MFRHGNARLSASQGRYPVILESFVRKQPTKSGDSWFLCFVLELQNTDAANQESAAIYNRHSCFNSQPHVKSTRAENQSHSLRRRRSAYRRYSLVLSHTEAERNTRCDG